MAVALFCFAFTQSVVMQAAEAAPGMTMPNCTMNMAADNADHGAPAEKSQKTTCPFCAAAAHAPLCADAALLPQSSAVAWTAYVSLRPLGPRGPSARAPNARGPPIPVLTL